ncbi:hypothetical protein HBI56_051900 [Parastagonospora nodorum]|uniref:Uncharacterized protein n=1 Tax=Phaeosphaeria nodorum (strain SN15 / ATCC MYA-4574 / FGSC 10173) TaxID=321614 RepID=A0A7U2ICZ2_PHANO|nr:hypothetical protein HBH56_100250 [Parastagonospora nodorum]QRD07510.1 hypothetical protein JI435_447580 [Parastagonospora nodorum SN15]KAH3930480.1 hypothetical protein HBH54_114570 [Parastagonospora nodorum]KAH3942832.1 hypothetical protein HBH53_181390 [Parastagonospora nodorum]KAH3964676.1 hypothetical protein HBH51_157490 [Parastagonospora nodorum]
MFSYRERRLYRFLDTHHQFTCSKGLSVVEASVENLQTALSNGRINSVQLIAKHIIRVARFDRRGPCSNALVVLNSNVFDHAQSSDDFRDIKGSVGSALEGLPGTLKLRWLD